MRGAAPFWLGVALLFVGATPTTAQRPEKPKPLVVTATRVQAPDSAAGGERAAAATPTDARALRPGDLVSYQLRFTNVTERPVRSVVFTNPVPNGLRYVAGSATSDRQDVALDFSIDGGRSYAVTPMIEEQVDGKRVVRPAPPEAYTHIRWTVTGWVQPDARVTAEFRARLPGGPKATATSSQPTGTGRPSPAQSRANP